MPGRVVVIAKPAMLRLELEALVVEHSGAVEGRVPLQDLDVLILEERRVTTTVALLDACASAGVSVVVCDRKHMPAALMLPVAGHTLHTKHLELQLKFRPLAKARLWRRIVRSKIVNQAAALTHAGGPGAIVAAIARRVLPGDPNNAEAQAARTYWPLLMGAAFRRVPQSGGVNALLDYGYAVLRAAVARAVVGAGLHPALGIHHRNQYDAYALADDLMEPLRPMVDSRILELTAEDAVVEMAAPQRAALLEILTREIVVGGQTLPIGVGLERYVASVRDVMAKSATRPLTPELQFARRAADEV